MGQPDVHEAVTVEDYDEALTHMSATLRRLEGLDREELLLSIDDVLEGRFELTEGR